LITPRAFGAATLYPSSVASTIHDILVIGGNNAGCYKFSKNFRTY